VSVFEGQCHCGAVAARFETPAAPEAIDVRACQCSFCRRHGAKTVGDPDGRLTLRFREADVARYRFGTGTSDFIVCKHCGAFAAATIEGFAVLNVVGMAIAALAAREARPVDYDSETPAARLERRGARWTPLVVELAA